MAQAYEKVVDGFHHCVECSSLLYCFCFCVECSSVKDIFALKPTLPVGAFTRHRVFYGRFRAALMYAESE